MNLGEERPFYSSVSIIRTVLWPLVFCASSGFELMMLKVLLRFFVKSILHNPHQLKIMLLCCRYFHTKASTFRLLLVVLKEISLSYLNNILTNVLLIWD